MKITLRLPVLLLTAALLAVTVRADFHDHIGIQLWSVRANTLAKGLPSSLDLMKGWGFTEIEGGISATGPTATQVRALLDARGLTYPSVHASYEQMSKDLPSVIRDAKILGAKFVICPWIPHQGAFDAATEQRAVADFNQWGAAFRAEGIRFGYHPHGYEFLPGNKPGNTLLDDLITSTNPDNVCFEMDVFWIYHGGGDPVGLLNKYSSRWVALHVKDIRKGAPYGKPTGGAPDTDNVIVGTGQIDWKAVIGTAEKIGIKYYFIEDETPAPLENIPASLAYLRALQP
jgi:sugar phosphate isomerase/epimerase